MISLTFKRQIWSIIQIKLSNNFLTDYANDSRIIIWIRKKKSRQREEDDMITIRRRRSCWCEIRSGATIKNSGRTKWRKLEHQSRRGFLLYVSVSMVRNKHLGVDPSIGQRRWRHRGLGHVTASGHPLGFATHTWGAIFFPHRRYLYDFISFIIIHLQTFVPFYYTRYQF